MEAEFQEFTMSELYERHKKRVDDMRNFIQFDGEFITLKGYYHIEKSRCDTPDKILGRVLHLSEKVWMTPLRLRWFIETACAVNNLPRPQ